MWSVSPALRSPYLLPQSVHGRRGVSDQKGRERGREEGEGKEGGREEGGGGEEEEGKGEGAHRFLKLVIREKVIVNILWERKGVCKSQQHIQPGRHRDHVLYLN